MPAWGSGSGHVPSPAGCVVLRFSCAADGTGLLVITAHAGYCAAGSVAVRAHGPGQVAVGRLHVVPGCRRRHVAQLLMMRVLEIWEHADIWLYAEPYVPLPGMPPGPPRQVLERFYASLGFSPVCDARGHPAMMKRACM